MAIFQPRLGTRTNTLQQDRTAFQVLIPENLCSNAPSSGKTAHRNHLQQTEKETVCGQVQVSPSSRTTQLPSSKQRRFRRIRLAACFLCASVVDNESLRGRPVAASLYRGYLSCVPCSLLSIPLLRKGFLPHSCGSSPQSRQTLWRGAAAER